MLAISGKYSIEIFKYTTHLSSVSETPAFIITNICHVGQGIKMFYFPRHFVVMSDPGCRSAAILVSGVAALPSGLLSSE